MRNKLFAISTLLLIVISLTYLLAACRKEQKTKGLQLVTQEIPAGFPAPAYKFDDNPVSQEGFELGRKLFYDGRLSIDNFHSCSSCHQQIAGFGTFEHDRSHGVNNTHTLRNAPVLFNLAWQNYFHWDGAYRSLIDETINPIHGAHEMGESFNGIVAKLEADADYRERFKKVFGYPFIRPEHIQKALSQFTGSLISADSKYDRVKKGQAIFTTQEQNGYVLYQAKCASCHPEPMFTDYSFRNIGLPIDPFLNDYGRMRITGKKEDSLKFKVPTLRNSAISSNYMHDGRFGTLYQCLDHYRSGIQVSPTLDPSLGTAISLTNTQTDELFAFLKTLTDSAFLRDTRFSQPR